MLTVVGIIVFLALLNITINRVRHFISTNFVITPEISDEFDLNDYLMVYQLTTRFNRRIGDLKVKDCVRENLETAIFIL
jgi:hypothetical protein